MRSGRYAKVNSERYARNQLGKGKNTIVAQALEESQDFIQEIAGS